jgi:acetyl-CoA carboxylase/biotin carboxylase 1
MTSVVAKMADAVSGAVNGHANGAPSSYAAKFNLAPHFIGGSELSKAPPSKVKDFVAASDGHTVISSVSLELPAARKSFPPPLQ